MNLAMSHCVTLPSLASVSFAERKVKVESGVRYSKSLRTQTSDVLLEKGYGARTFIVRLSRDAVAPLC